MAAGLVAGARVRVGMTVWCGPCACRRSAQHRIRPGSLPRSTNTGALVDQIRAVLQLVRTQRQILEIRHEHSSPPTGKQQPTAAIRALAERCRSLERILRSYTSSSSAPSSRLTRSSDCVATIAGSADPRSVDAA